MTLTVPKYQIDSSGVDALPLGRTPTFRIYRSLSIGWNFNLPDDADPYMNDAFAQFLAALSIFIPKKYRTGVTFYRVIPAGACELNETHRDKGTGAMNATSIVTEDETTYQLEFFANDDENEERPILTSNNFVQLFEKDLHRRPERPAGTHKRVFFSANLYRV